MTILNLTQHTATADQVADGVVDLPENHRLTLCMLLTFRVEDVNREVLLLRAYKIANIANEYFQTVGNTSRERADRKVLVGGAPYFMSYLERCFHWQNLQIVYSLSERVSVEETLPDGSVTKKTIFCHKGFFEPGDPFDNYA